MALEVCRPFFLLFRLAQVLLLDPRSQGITVTPKRKPVPLPDPVPVVATPVLASAAATPSGDYASKLADTVSTADTLGSPLSFDESKLEEGACE